MDESGIFEELHAERQELERMIKVAKNITKEEVILSSAPFFSLEEKEGKLLITGIALAEGVWKSVLYPAEEIEKSATHLQGKPLKVEHGLDALFETREVGTVKKAYYDRALKSIVFQAEVTDPEAIKLVKDGTFPAVSCSTWVDKFPLNQEQSIGFNFNFNELSLVRTPACEKCFIFAVEELSKKISQEKQDLNNQSPQIINNKEAENMSEEKEEVIEELEEDVDLSEVEQPKLFAVIETEKLSDIEEDLAKKVVSYYYGYGYPYGYKGKYPYPAYPYYPYYPYSGKKGKYPYKKPEKKSLWALLELESPEEIEDLKKRGKKIAAVYYGYYGYPHYGYPYYGKKYGYPYYPYYPYYGKYPQKKSEEDDSEEEMKHGYYPYYPYYPYYGKYGKYPYYPYYGYKKQKKGLAIVEEEDGTMTELEIEEDALDELAKKKKVKGYYPYYYKYPEKKAEEQKCPEGQVWDEKEQKCIEAPKEMAKVEPYPCPKGTEWDEEKKQCVELSEELSDAFAMLDELALPKDYVTFMKKCMKESKTMPVVKRMKECAEAFKKQTKPEEKAEEEYKCPEGQVFDEKEKKCVPIEKKEAYPAPEKDSGKEFTDMEPGKIEVAPGPAEDAAKIAAKLSTETVKKEEDLSISKVEIPMSKEEKPCEECPKKEEEKASEKKPEPAVVPAAPVAPKVEEVKEPPKAEVPKEEPKVEAPKEEPKVETPKVETPKVEEPKVEEPKVEPPKAPTPEEIAKETLEYLKQHPEDKEKFYELLVQQARKKKFP